MEVRAGYKQTEIGVIPDDWELMPLGDLVFSVEYGSSSKSDIQGKMPVLRMCNLQEGKITWDDLVYTSNQEEIKKYKLHSGDVLFNRTNTIDLVGKTSIYTNDHPAIFAGYLIRINANHSKLNTLFLNYVLNTDFSRNYSRKVLSVAVGQANINGQKLKTYPIPIPPTLAEQEAIAAALSDADALSTALERLIAKKRQIKQGAMQELLTGKRRLPGFENKNKNKKTKVGIIPEDWKILPMNSLGSFAKGAGIKKDEATSGQIPCVRYGEIYTHYNDIIRNFNSWISPEVAKSSKQLRIGDLLFAGSGETKEEIGKCVAFTSDDEVYAGGDIIILSPKVGVSEFFGYLFNSPIVKMQKASKGQGDAIVHISCSALSNILIPFPPLSEQKAIATALNDMDTEIFALEAKLSKVRQIKQGMMQELLTGKVRLI